MSGIVLGFEGRLVIGEAIVTVTCLAAVLGEFVFIAIGILVGRPRVVGFGCGLAPSVVVAIVFWCGGTDVA